MSNLLALLPVILWCSSTFAGDLKSAGFRPRSNSLQNRISYPPNAADGTVVMKCAGTVGKRGYFEPGIVCYPNYLSQQSTRPFVSAILRASERVKLNPAYVNGWQHEVWFNFSVAFHKSGDEKIIEVYPNHLLNYDEYGERYTSPQRYTLRGSVTQLVAVHI